MIDRVALHRIILNHFDLAGFKQLCFELHVNDEDLEAIGRSEKARLLVQRLAHERRLADLVDLIAQHRPSLDLSYLTVFSPQVRLRPAPLGSSISHFRGGAATLGCLVTERDNPRKLYILSDLSGLCPVSLNPRRGDPIIQPGETDGGSAAADALARLERWAGLSDDPQADTNVSAALALVVDETAVSPQIHERGFIQGVRPAAVGMAVFGYGRTTSNAQAAIRQTGFSYEMPWPAVQVEQPGRPVDAQGNVPIPFTDLIVTGPMLQAGDSGMVLLDSQNYAIGLGFAGSDQMSLFMPMQKVLDTLAVQLVTETMWHSLVGQE
jgi:hypothetical protein